MRSFGSSLASIFVLALVLVPLAGGCSSTSAPATPTCDSSKCAPGNQCIEDVDGTMCRLVCADSTGCPFNYTCALPQLTTSTTPYCVADSVQLANNPGTWGTPCSPANGYENPACDGSQGFRCDARSPTDGEAFCTIYNCTDDTMCPGGWWCGKVNQAPNATNAKRSKGATTNVCIPRVYCSPCTSDVDCSPLNGVTQHCIADTSGANFCTPECTSDSNCELEASCKAESGVANGSKVCFPRAGVCVGDGGFCAPCRTDADCTGGYCVQADYSQEKFCTVTSKTPCNVTTDASGNMVLNADCPKTDEAGVPVGCATTPDDPNIPLNECIGIVSLGKGTDEGSVVGCYTPSH